MPSGISAWRIAKQTPEFSADDLSGGGAKKTGGRWNSKGHAVLYASTTIALATLETLAHLGDNIAIRNAFLTRIDIPAPLWERRERLVLAHPDPTWQAEPAGSTSIAIGDRWLAGATAALLEVPSVIVPEECNVLINPAHPDARRITATIVRLFHYDPRF